VTSRSVFAQPDSHVERQGKGDHEIWYSPISGLRFPLDADIRSRHTANLILKQAGLDKAY